MWKYLLILALAIMIGGGGTCPAFADSVWDHAGDALSGHNDFIETNMYVAKTISLEKVPYVSVLNADLRVKMSTPIGDDSFRKGILEVGLEW